MASNYPVAIATKRHGVVAELTTRLRTSYCMVLAPFTRRVEFALPWRIDCNINIATEVIHILDVDCV